ncbi:MAG: bifunctional hydroxymethylpyrimidine kinase/phosphomethylpyrimidine kinase [Gammaproteobacteria bacterium HGW-Gammaproteobacteria-1]|jgi:hydroxymethylpyrimidine/phosphomethylpyrimidine kinase|nr:MAG: bifunctional hydroxymethylpyrimidine kinase/phosphomethylpyrimidine kinase [Gammaproteobacteria bacterium HGW-Gammaproteobacteria-2]PKM41659.1 MAG: bifunctional hydroxymethylpyrimidine kinase/phosphomethylpyrimidine kinase [Gammaproteobacteria bacterium HGW-Gammaproteobacteria-1]
MTIDPRPLCALTIAGSDSGGGAGIQADLKTFAAHGVHGLCAIAALTAQNTRGVSAVHVPPAGFLRAQIDACFDDFRVGVIKIGMLANAELIDAVIDAIEAHEPAFVVLDPVMVATSGARLLDADALDALRRLIAHASLITPNIPEAEWLLAETIADDAAAERAMDALLALGAGAVLLKGAHLPAGDPGDAHAAEVTDRFSDGRERIAFRNPRLPIEGHGSGCTLASAIAAQCVLGKTLPQACADAITYVAGALAHSTRPGRGDARVLAHFWRMACAPR